MDLGLQGKKAIILGGSRGIARIIGFVSSPAGMWINAAHIVADGGQVASVD